MSPEAIVAGFFFVLAAALLASRWLAAVLDRMARDRAAEALADARSALAWDRHVNQALEVADEDADTVPGEPIYAALAAERMREALDDDEALRRWLS